jgi:2-oxoacid:acceptor oxidoreductase delta subunit (pyruvate/2-ketoisovalerate family)
MPEPLLNVAPPRPGAVVFPTDRPAPHTGGWRMGEKPAVHLEACVNCLLCWQFCPDGAIRTEQAVFLGVDYDYCKGCELCVAVCPTHALEMVDEETPTGPYGRLAPPAQEGGGAP